MLALLQRVSCASVAVAGERIAEIGPGLVALVCALPSDSRRDAAAMAGKIANVRIFSDEKQRMNRSLLDTGGSCLLISQFTLAADLSRGRRPHFKAAAEPEQARRLCADLADELRSLAVPTREGRFAADMQVTLTNDGPVTLMLEVPRRQKPAPAE